MTSSTFRYADGVVPNVLALGFVLLGWPAGIALLAQPQWALNMLGFILVVLSLNWSAYFIHEFAHLAIFKKPVANARWGTLMSWLNGSCYARFEDMRKKHMRHHVERADVISLDIRGFLLAAPAWQRKVVLALEWMHFPAVEFIMRGFVISLPFHANAKLGAGNLQPKLRILGIALVRTVGWIAVGWLSIKALFLYFAAYVCFVICLRFADCFQHTYDAYPILDDTPIPADKLRDKAYEQANTFSDVVGLRSTLLNLIWLNFGFHNAHHDRPTLPWYKLPTYHQEIYTSDYAQVITVGQLLRSFHVNRIKRIVATDYGQVKPYATPGRADQFVGAVGVSFLTAV